MRKYGNKKTIVDGFGFDSKLEAKRYNELKMLLRSGVITDLTLQKVFLLQDGDAESKENIQLAKDALEQVVKSGIYELAPSFS